QSSSGAWDKRWMAAAADPRTLLEALDAVSGVAGRGFTFADDAGRERFTSFQDLVKEARRCAGAFAALGYARGARVVLIIPDQQAFVVTFLGAMTAGLVPVPVYPPSSLARIDVWLETTTGILRTSGAVAAVTVEEVGALLYLTTARPGVAVVTLKQLDAAAGGAGGPPARAGLDDVAFLQFTSGSTGAPRGVMVSHRNIFENCAGMLGQILSATDEPRGVSWLPLYHDMGLIGFVLTPIFGTCPVTFLPPPAFLKRPALWLELIHRHRATVTVSPNFGYALAVRRISAEAMAAWDLSCLHIAGCGGEPVDP